VPNIYDMPMSLSKLKMESISSAKNKLLEYSTFKFLASPAYGYRCSVDINSPQIS
jgi:hypothetical protein